MAHLTEKPESASSLFLLHWGPRCSEGIGMVVQDVPAPWKEEPGLSLSPDWLPRLDVNWGWRRHIAGEDVNPHVKGSLGTHAK